MGSAADREEVAEKLKDTIDGLKIVKRRIGRLSGFGVEAETISDAIAILKEQEPISPKKEHSGSGITWWHVCGNCGVSINPNAKYCHQCGRAVKWDADN